MDNLLFKIVLKFSTKKYLLFMCKMVSYFERLNLS